MLLRKKGIVHEVLPDVHHHHLADGLLRLGKQRVRLLKNAVDTSHPDQLLLAVVSLYKIRDIGHDGLRLQQNIHALFFDQKGDHAGDGVLIAVPVQIGAAEGTSHVSGRADPFLFANITDQSGCTSLSIKSRETPTSELIG